MDSQRDTLKDLSQKQLLEVEMRIFEIGVDDGKYYTHAVRVGDDFRETNDLNECAGLIKKSVEELKMELWKQWVHLGHLADELSNSYGFNTGSIENLLFLHNLKKCYMLAGFFSSLDAIRDKVRSIFNIDVGIRDPDVIEEFNNTALRILVLHRSVMRETYRVKLISAYSSLTKTAQISGPWANLDLPLKERVWQWDEEESNLMEREKARKNQLRYNPEYNIQGFYFVWQDRNRDPYLFEKRREESPYPQRERLQIP